MLYVLLAAQPSLQSKITQYNNWKQVNEYDQEIPQSHTADQP